MRDEVTGKMRLLLHISYVIMKLNVITIVQMLTVQYHLQLLIALSI